MLELLKSQVNRDGPYGRQPRRRPDRTTTTTSSTPTAPSAAPPTYRSAARRARSTVGAAGTATLAGSAWSFVTTAAGFTSVTALYGSIVPHPRVGEPRPLDEPWAYQGAKAARLT